MSAKSLPGLNAVQTARYRQLMFKSPVSRAELDEYFELRNRINVAEGRVERVAPAASAPDGLPIKETVHRDELGRWVTSDGKLIDLAELSRRNMARMATHGPTMPDAEPGSGEAYSRAHYRAHIRN